MANKYPFNIAWSEEDQAYVATCPAFPGLSAFGNSEEDAVTEAKVALAAMIEACRKKKIPLPEPRTVEAYSGQTRLRLSKSLHRQAATMAQAEEVSLNQYIVDALVAKIAGEQAGSKVIAAVKQHLKETLFNSPRVQSIHRKSGAKSLA
jgi:predicted RNase H-like HicB family nuclease